MSNKKFAKKSFLPMAIVYNLFVIIFTSTHAYANETLAPAITQPIPIEQIKDYSNYPSVVAALIQKALKLSQMNLTYQYGSADPKNKGMDCSGTIYYLLK